MGVIMGKIVEVKGKPTQLILQALDEEDLEKQVDAINEMERKAKAWEQFKNDYHTEITQAIDNLFKLNNVDIAGETIFLLEKILSDLEDE